CTEHGNLRQGRGGAAAADVAPPRRAGEACMTFTTENGNTEQIENEASVWFLTRDGGTMSPEQEAAFAEWLARSPKHEEAYSAVEAIWSAASQLERHPSFETTRRWAIAAAARGRATRRVVLTGLAAAVIGMGGLAVYLQ